ncbi:S8 family serine peptidase [Lentzea sp. NPDC058436]|uniref:S8 family peptidase n=1 Tax=Lentzea sp. NPDC058436 TaxID=3346499 RepID=UPI0036648D0D
MTIYWPDSPHAAEPENTGLAFQVPDEVLQRHGARVLDPATATTGLAGPALQPTAYVANVLLVPIGLLRSDRGTLNNLLAVVKMTIDPDFPVPDLPDDDVQDQAVPVPLTPSEGLVTIDAWTAVQAIRANKEIGPLVGLDHLMFASLLGDLSGVPGAIQGFAPPFGLANPVADGYLNGPVALEMPPLDPAPPAALKLGRSPVVAVLDTGIGQNSWLDITQPMSGQPGQHVVVDGAVQAAVAQAGQGLLKQGHRVEVMNDAKDQPLTRNPFIGTQDWCFGHGLFCAGIIKQIAPDATVLAVRVMGSDGVARESAVVAALQALVARVDRALGTADMAEMVDVVSLSMGCAFERPVADEKTSAIAVQIRELRKRGVIVTAAIGNAASNRRFFPASLATIDDGVRPPVISVGALNPNGSIALFSNESPTCYASGVNVISTFPQDANASRQPLVRVAARNAQKLPPYRQTPDVDDHTLSPFAVWTGTSFAAPHVAAHLAKALQHMESAGATAAERQEQARVRAEKAIDQVRTAAHH